MTKVIIFSSVFKIGSANELEIFWFMDHCGSTSLKPDSIEFDFIKLNLMIFCKLYEYFYKR